MSAGRPSALRVALLHDSYSAPPQHGAPRLLHDLALALQEAGHRPRVISSGRGVTRSSVEEPVPVVRVGRLPEAPLRFRGFTGPLTHLPGCLVALLRDDYHAAHAFAVPDVLAALWWRRFTNRPVLFTWAEAARREQLADRRLRLSLVQRAVEEVDAVLAPSESVRASIEHWLAVDVRVLSPHDTDGHLHLYREAAARRSAVAGRGDSA